MTRVPRVTLYRLYKYFPASPSTGTLTSDLWQYAYEDPYCATGGGKKLVVSELFNQIKRFQLVFHEFCGLGHVYALGLIIIPVITFLFHKPVQYLQCTCFYTRFCAQHQDCQDEQYVVCALQEVRVLEEPYRHRKTSPWFYNVISVIIKMQKLPQEFRGTTTTLKVEINDGFLEEVISEAKLKGRIGVGDVRGGGKLSFNFLTYKMRIILPAS